jgi:hypothetical protein
MIVDLSLPAVDVLSEDLGLTGLPFPLEVRSHGDTTEERARIKAAVYGLLEQRELAMSGAPVPKLAEALRLLSAPKISIDLVALIKATDSQPMRAVVAARGKRAVLAVQRDLTINLSTVRESAIVSSILELLPPVKAGPGLSLALPGSVLDRRDGGRHRRTESGNGAVLSAVTEHHNELRILDSIMERPTIRAGTIGVVLRDDRGRVQRLPGIGFFDTDQGRYATTVQRGGDGEDWTSLSPADNSRLSHRLAETLVTALQRE